MFSFKKKDCVLEQQNYSDYNVPILIKKKQRQYAYSVHTVMTTDYLVEGFTNGYYYENNGVKYYSVKDSDFEKPVYYDEQRLVFLKKCQL